MPPRTMRAIWFPPYMPCCRNSELSSGKMAKINSPPNITVAMISRVKFNLLPTKAHPIVAQRLFSLK